jgi:uroporphyrinogen-III synthase
LKVKNILVSQPQPVDYEKSPYYDISKKFGVNFTFRKLFRIEGLTAQEFRRERINIIDYTAIIFTCKNAVDHFFRICSEMRIKMPETTKYFCISETTAYYLQKYVQYRKRKIFHGNENSLELINILKKHLQEKFLLPCAEDHKQEAISLIAESKIPLSKACIYKTVPADLSDLDVHAHDMIVFFSPFGISSLFTNFPEFEQKNLLIAAFGASTHKVALERELVINVVAPTEKAPSMTMAIEQFLDKNNKK